MQRTKSPPKRTKKIPKPQSLHEVMLARPLFIVDRIKQQSGMGRRSGVNGLLRFTESRTIGVANKSPIGLPTRAKQYKFMAPVMTKLVRLMGKL